MVIGFDELLPRVRKGELIRHLSARELENPEGAGFDLRAGELYQQLRPLKEAVEIDRLLLAAGILGSLPLAA